MAHETIKCPHCECKVLVSEVEKEDGACPECGQLVLPSKLFNDFSDYNDEDEDDIDELNEDELDEMFEDEDDLDDDDLDDDDLDDDDDY